jgi:lysophospholipase L1-like esterase
MIYLALGDSITTGFGVGANQCFAALFYKDLLAYDPGLKYMNLGMNGLRSEELAFMVGQTRFYPLITQAKVISLTIGSNDLLAVGKGLISGAGANLDQTLGNLQRNLMLIGDCIRKANPSVLVKISTIYKPLISMNKQSLELTQGLVKTANHSITRMAREYRFTVVPVAKAFSGREQLLLGPDYLHPNPRGHRVIADLFAKN